MNGDYTRTSFSSSWASKHGDLLNSIPSYGAMPPTPRSTVDEDRERKKPTKAQRRAQLIAFCSYLIFMSMLIAMPLIEYEVPTAYGLNAGVTALFTEDHMETFDEIHTISDFEEWGQSTLLPVLFCQHDPKLGTGEETKSCRDKVVSIFDPDYAGDEEYAIFTDILSARRCTKRKKEKKRKPDTSWEATNSTSLIVDPLVDYCRYSSMDSDNLTCSDSSSLVTRVGLQNVLLGSVEVNVRLSTSVCSLLKGSNALGTALATLGGSCRSNIDDGEVTYGLGIDGKPGNRYIWQERAFRNVKKGPFERLGAYKVNLPPGRRGLLCYNQLFRDELIAEPRTRQVAISMLVYNSYKNMVGRFTLDFHFEPTGYSVKRHYFSSYRLWQVGADGLGVNATRAALQGLLLTFFLLYAAITVGDFFVSYLRVMRVHSYETSSILFGWLEFFKNGFHVVDFLNIGICSYILALRVGQVKMMSRLNDTSSIAGVSALTGVDNPDYVGAINKAITMRQGESNWLTVNILISFFKMFKYLMHFRRLSLPIHTIGESATELLYFGVLVVGNLAAFIIIGHFAFGVYVREFRTFQASIKSMVGFILGDFSVGDRELYQINPFIALIFFYSYVLYVVVFLYNVALGIVFYTYSERRKQLKPVNMRRSVSRVVDRLRTKLSVANRKDAFTQDDDDNADDKGRRWPRPRVPSFFRRKRGSRRSQLPAQSILTEKENSRRPNTFNPLFDRIVAHTSHQPDADDL